MSAMVSARVPVEVKKQGDAKLRELGATVTDLVNAAYEYLIDNGQIPGTKRAEKASEPMTKVLDREASAKLRARWNHRQALDAPGYDGQNFRELLNEARESHHARLA